MGIVIAVVAAVLIFAGVMWLFPLVAETKLPSKSARTMPEGPRGDEVCDPGPHDVESGTFTYLELDVRKDDRIEGLLSETDGYDFDWSIVDQGNLAAALNEREYDVDAGNEGVSADEISWIVPDYGQWYLLLTAPRRQIVREVEVHLGRVE